jgi:allophanate hydrolase
MINSFDIQSLHCAYAAGVSPRDMLAAVYTRIAQVADDGIFIHLISEDDAARSVESLGAFDPVAKPLWGVPFAVKDNIDVAGLPTTAACVEFTYIADTHATVVARLLAAGAILIGKTNLDQFATGLVGVRSPWPHPKNAIDPTLAPGGSSSGSAVAVAQGIVTFALGTDTAGSGRIPAGLNNIVGLKPSLGLLSTKGVTPACRTLDCVSIFAGSTDDSWRVLQAAAAFDAADPYSRACPAPALSRPPRLRVGVPDKGSRRFFGDAIAEETFDAHLALLAKLDGVELIQIDITPFLQVAELLYGGPWVAERRWAVRSIMDSNPDSLLPVTRKIIGAADGMSAVDAFDGLYKLAAMRRATEPVWKRIDMLAVPTMPTLATLKDLEADPIGPNSRLGVYTNFVNLLDLAALAIPGAFRKDKRAAGLTFIAPAGCDGLLAGVGRQFHGASNLMIGATSTPVPAAAATPDRASPDRIELVVVGAHLSGMALNHELTSIGASFVRATTTSADYQLFALPGGPPKRPGLVRVADGAGHQLAVEVWALEPASFGGFVSRIPEPLGVGNLRLADGTRAKGFLCEAEAIKDALDISAHRGWRAFIAAG